MLSVASAAGSPLFNDVVYWPQLTTTVGGITSTQDTAFFGTSANNFYAVNAATGATIWQLTLMKSLNGGTVNAVPTADTGGSAGSMFGINGTPVIDPCSLLLYVVSQVKETPTDGSGVFTYSSQLWAIDIRTGAINATHIIGSRQATCNGGAGVRCSGVGTPNAPSIPSNTQGSIGGRLYFDALLGNQRPGLNIVNGVIIVGYAGYNNYVSICPIEQSVLYSFPPSSFRTMGG